MKPLIERLTPTMLLRLHERKISNADAAARMKVSETYLSRTVATLQDKVPGQYRIERESVQALYKARLNTRAMLAKQVLKGDITLEKACKQANCSARTMLRYMAKYRRKPSKFARRG